MAIDETQPPGAGQPEDFEPGTLASDFYAAGSPSPEADSGDAPPMTPEQESAMLRAALAEANEEIARQADAVQRGHADLANARRRHDEERLTIQRQANSRLLVGLLPIVDELGPGGEPSGKRRHNVNRGTVGLLVRRRTINPAQAGYVPGVPGRSTHRMPGRDFQPRVARGGRHGPGRRRRIRQHRRGATPGLPIARPGRPGGPGGGEPVNHQIKLAPGPEASRGQSKNRTAKYIEETRQWQGF